MVVIRKKENRPEAADHIRSKTRNQHWIDFLRSTGVFLSVVNEDQPSGWHATAIPHGRLPLSPGGPKRKRRTRGSGLTAVGSRGCLRCLLLVMCTHPFAKKAFTLHLSRSEGHERYFGCNLMHRKALASSHQHLMAEAPGPEQIADLPVPVAESPGAVRIGHPERSHLVEYLAPNSVFNSLPRQRSSPHLRPDDRLVTIDRVLHHASLGVA